MGTDLVPAPPPAELAASYDAAIKAAVDFAAASRATATLRAYRSDWRHFTGWCAAYQLAPLPATPATVAAYLAAAAGKLKLATVKRRCAAIGHFHRQNGHDVPTSHPGVQAALQGIARQLGSAPAKKAALTVDLVAKAVRKIPDDLAGLRDRALILLGFAAALRRSELVALKVNDVARHPKGLLITVRRSKTDQAGAGKIKAVPRGKLKVVEAIDAWLIAARITQGPVFRSVRGTAVSDKALSGYYVARIVQKRCAAIGLDAKAFGGHSLRSGFITSAADAGAPLAAIAKHAGHAKLDTTLGYVQVADAFRDHSGKRFL